MTPYVVDTGNTCTKDTKYYRTLALYWTMKSLLNKVLLYTKNRRNELLLKLGEVKNKLNFLLGEITSKDYVAEHKNPTQEVPPIINIDDEMAR